jgi:hypothetical protein
MPSSRGHFFHGWFGKKLAPYHWDGSMPDALAETSKTPASSIGHLWVGTGQMTF